MGELSKRELAPCPFCGVRGKVEPRGGFMTAAFRHADWCFFNHGLPDRPMVLHESEFEEWNKRVFECIANDDGTIEILGHRFVPLRICRFIYANGGDFAPVCSACGYESSTYECSWLGDGGYKFEGNYCPHCGAKVVEG